MKKIVGIVAAASLVAGLAFADGPTANLNVADFTGNAQVQWGVDLDAGATGFKNSEYMKFVLNLFDAGAKTTEKNGDVWAELVMKAGNCKSYTHRLFQYDKNTDFSAEGYQGGINDAAISIDIDTAKIHFGDFYVGILNGDTTTGEYKFDSAIRGYDHWRGQGKWLTDVGPADYTQGIVAGYGNNNLGVDVDFRSYGATKFQYTSDYALAAELKLKDSNEWVEGLAVDLGGSMNLTKGNYYTSSTKKAGTAAKEELLWGKLPDNTDGVTYVGVTCDGLAAATKTTEGWYVKKTAKVKESGVDGAAVETKNDTTVVGYSANVAYKLKLDDKYWLKPAVAFTGTLTTKEPRNTSNKTVKNDNRLVAGLMLGWGNPGDQGSVYYFDSDERTNKVCPGVSVVAQIPLASKVTTTTAAGTTSTTANNAVLALIVPSFYTNGELVEGLSAGVYSEIALLRGESTNVTGQNAITYATAKDTSDTFAFALAAAVKYDIKADDITVTPQAGFRFINASYDDNKINSLSPLSNQPFFANYGDQKKVADATSKRNGLNDGGFFNLKAGVNVNGLINNTDLFLVYESANLMNAKDYSNNKYDDGTAMKFYNIKAGTLNVGCKISF